LTTDDHWVIDGGVLKSVEKFGLLELKREEARLITLNWAQGTSATLKKCTNRTRDIDIDIDFVPQKKNDNKKLDEISESLGW
jgi:hypothetical protein